MNAIQVVYKFSSQIIYIQCIMAEIKHVKIINNKKETQFTVLNVHHFSHVRHFFGYMHKNIKVTS